MITGMVNTNREAIIQLVALGPQGHQQEIEAVIDTGFTGFLTMPPALAAVRFLEETPADKIARYKNGLKFFMQLYAAVRRRYAEVVDFKEYEGKIQKLIDTHVGTGEVEKITELVNIFDAEAFANEVDKLGSTASKADTIAHRTKKTIEERMGEDPAFYQKFSELLAQAIVAFRQQRLSDAAYLSQVTEIAAKVRNRTGDDIPPQLQHHDVAKAFYGVLLEIFSTYTEHGFDPRDTGAEAGLHIDAIVQDHTIVNWVNNTDVQNQIKGAIEDYLFELKEARGFDLTFEDIDRVLELCLDIARVRYAA
jgi:type I restriction enzyme R subunit